MPRQSETFTLEVNEDSLKELLARFENAPKKIQKNATGVALTAGAKVVVNAAKNKAPACIRSTIKIRRRRTRGWKKTLSVEAGRGNTLLDMNVREKNILRKAGSQNLMCYPAMWYEFGTYGNRNYRGDEPYAPATLEKKSYASGRSDSPFWKHKSKWTPATPFLRPAISDPNVEKAMAKKLGEYLNKKGF